MAVKESGGKLTADEKVVMILNICDQSSDMEKKASKVAFDKIEAAKKEIMNEFNEEWSEIQFWKKEELDKLKGM